MAAVVLLLPLLLATAWHPADGAQLNIRFDSGFRFDSGANCSFFRTQLEVSTLIQTIQRVANADDAPGSTGPSSSDQSRQINQSPEIPTRRHRVDNWRLIRMSWTVPTRPTWRHTAAF